MGFLAAQCSVDSPDVGDVETEILPDRLDERVPVGSTPRYEQEQPRIEKPATPGARSVAMPRMSMMRSTSHYMHTIYVNRIYVQSACFLWHVFLETGRFPRGRRDVTYPATAPGDVPKMRRYRSSP